MDCKQVIIDAGLRMYASALTVETWGNISFREAETGNMYITPSGMDYHSCCRDDILVFSADGVHLEGKRKPSIELDLHLAVLRNRPDANAVIHTHPIHSMVFACLKRDIPLIIDEAAQVLGDVVRVADYALPGTRELADNCVKALGSEGSACLLQSHGAVCIGDSMAGAFRTATVLEMTAQIYYMTLQLGEPMALRPEHIAVMKDFFRNKYGQGR